MTSWGRLVRLAPMVVDVVFAVVVTFLVVTTQISERRHLEYVPAVGVWLLVGLAPALAVRRRWPGTCLALVALIQLGLFLTHTAAGANVPAELIAPYSAAAYANRRAQIGAGVIAGLVVAVAAFGWSVGTGLRDALAGAVLLSGVAWVAGSVVRARRERAGKVADRASRLERERDALTRAAVADERLRIARELHDVVAHHLSVVVVQAQALATIVDHDPEQARVLSASIEDTGREALTEMRHLLGILRAPESAEVAGAPDPQPGLDQVPALVEQVRRTGLAVDLTMDGDPGLAPQAVQVSGYRIVQEALTNVLKHAGPASVVVEVEATPHEVRLAIVDDGRGAAAGLARDPGVVGGHGLVGMRERVGMFGGQVRAGARPGGGYEVRASIPIERRPS